MEIENNIQNVGPVKVYGVYFLIRDSKMEKSHKIFKITASSDEEVKSKTTELISQVNTPEFQKEYYIQDVFIQQGKKKAYYVSNKRRKNNHDWDNVTWNKIKPVRIFDKKYEKYSYEHYIYIMGKETENDVLSDEYAWDQVWEYLYPKESGLPVTIVYDEDTQFNRPQSILFCPYKDYVFKTPNDRARFIPMVICDDPYIPDDYKHRRINISNEELQQIKDWVTKYKDILLFKHDMLVEEALKKAGAITEEI